MNTILFDIDGTLMSTGGAGMQAIGLAMRELFGVESLPQLDVHGRTDRFIFENLLRHVQLDFDQHIHRVSQRYWELLPETLIRLPGRTLPGVVEFLDRLSQSSQVQLGLLTGNARRPAEIKLDRFALGAYFQFGGFGDLHVCRNEVARVAVEAARSALGPVFEGSRVWVIGDTVDDIRCARAIGAKVIALETGGSSPEELRQLVPDLQLESLESGWDDLLGLFELD